MGMVEECHSDKYDWQQLFLEPASCGHTAVSRPRTYVIGSRSDDCRALHDLYEQAEKVTGQLRWTESECVTASCHGHGGGTGMTTIKTT